mgnify:CR=1 FL=1
MVKFIYAIIENNNEGIGNDYYKNHRGNAPC